MAWYFDVRQKEEDKDVNFVLYTSVDPKAKANAALLMALYVVRYLSLYPIDCSGLTGSDQWRV